jgi:hypothetical protein
VGFWNARTGALELAQEGTWSWRKKPDGIPAAAGGREIVGNRQFRCHGCGDWRRFLQRPHRGAANGSARKETRPSEDVAFVIRTIAFTPESRSLVYGGGEMTLNVRDVATGGSIPSLKGHAGRILRFGDARRLLLRPTAAVHFGGSGRHIAVWRADTGDTLITMMTVQSGRVGCDDASGILRCVGTRRQHVARARRHADIRDRSVLSFPLPAGPMAGRRAASASRRPRPSDGLVPIQ